MEKPELSIIIVSYNTKNITKECIDKVVKSLANSKLKYEIVVVDNASKDGSVKMFQQYRQKLKDKLNLILSDENLGFGRGNNLGIKHAKGKYLLLLNSDAFALDDAISKLLKFYKQNEDHIHFLGPKLHNKDMSDQPSAAHFYTLPIIFAALFMKGDYWGLTRFSPNRFQRVDWISGACILTKKKYYDGLEGFDKTIFMYMEEVDLLYRAKQMGYSTHFYPGARFIHLGSASSGGRTFPIIQVYKGFLFFYKKHYSDSALFWLKFMLKLKAGIAVLIGRITQNRYLIDTYEKAYQLVKMDR